MAKILLIEEPGKRFFTAPIIQKLEDKGHETVILSALDSKQMAQVHQIMAQYPDNFDAVVLTNLGAVAINEEMGGPGAAGFAKDIVKLASDRPVITYDSSLSQLLKAELRNAGLTVLDSRNIGSSELVAAVNDTLTPKYIARSM